MKNIYLFLIVLISFNSQAQLGFEEHLLNSYSNSLYPYKAILVDIDNDGFLDVISTDSYSIKWFKNLNGLENFDNAQIVTDNLSAPSSFDVKDVDGDGFVDVVLSSYENDVIVWYRNDGQGSFGSGQVIANVVRPTELSLTDIDGDGHLDILVSFWAYGTWVSWYKNDGVGNFGTAQIITSNTGNVHELQAADINGDGHLDIFYLSGFMKWYENDGLGNFGPVNIINTYGDPKDISLVDLDGDGHLDILVSESLSMLNHDKVAWYRNMNGQGSFSAEITILIKPSNNSIQTLSAFDISGNGNLDLVIEFSGPGGNKLVWHENLGGQNNFGPEQIISLEVEESGSSQRHFNFGDINGDGDKDLLWLSGQHINWFESLNGQGSFGEKKIINKHFGTPFDSCIADIDNDGDIDVVASIGDKIVVYENTNGNGEMKIKQIIYSSTFSILCATDVDNDGYVDLIVRKKDGNGHKLVWHKNNGQGHFGVEQMIVGNSATSGSGNRFLLSIFAVDINGDGKLDILTNFHNPNKISWYENIDNLGNFGPEQIIVNNSFITTIYPSDINGDGSIDIVAGYQSGGTSWIENDGLGNFGQGVPIGQGGASVFAVDIDGDGFTDVLTAGEINSGIYAIILYKNSDGLGNFNPPQIITNDVIDPTGVFAVDLNNNGHIDIISLSSGKISWYENLGSQGSFSPQQIISGSFPHPWKIVAGDINGNGYNDLVSISSYIFEEELTFHENLGVLGNQIFGNIKYDANGNGCYPNDLPMENVMVVADNGTNSFTTFTQANGDYYIQTTAGDFVTSVSSQFPTYFDRNPLSHNSNFTGLGNTAMADFCVTSNQNINDLNVSIYPLTDARAGFDASYQLVFGNTGSTIMSGNVDLNYDNTKMNLLSASQIINSQTANTLTFNFIDLDPYETRAIDIHFNVEAPPITDINDILIFEATINPVTGDNNVDDNTYIFEQIVIGSYDPNDIRVLEGNEIYFDEVENYLHYIIRFQNTGTADAINVVVENDLDSSLDWSTLQVQNISHDNRVEIKDGYMVKFIFDNIHLPDSISNEPASHGHIAYKIKPKSTMRIGDFVNNTASIFFDFNPPIITNTVTTTVVERLNTPENNLESIKIYPNPTNAVFYISSSIPITEVSIFNNMGQEIINSIDKNGVRNIDVSTLASGIYFMRLKNESESWIYKKIIKK